ncbi:141aa long hypothetical protein [Pyrococcus horikoshii OT3]|uniref:Uncharacterized protein n=1 Tax=Pyrococcus horikoshii (strain ATCC 700860 / DSM 12428 / JCM 9974 / NBRC 100139 / OT-3) TaxID=70601 RepID=O58309_PYRHO|nr:141aa long hypothetical protein [Pyrococcus horikoshii OT3]
MFGFIPVAKITSSALYSPASVTTFSTLSSPSIFIVISCSLRFTCFFSFSSKISVTSLSKDLLRTLSPLTIIVTFFPWAANASAISIPMYPPPIITTFSTLYFSMYSLIAKASGGRSAVNTPLRLTPSIAGTCGEAPLAKTR